MFNFIRVTIIMVSFYSSRNPKTEVLRNSLTVKLWWAVTRNPIGCKPVETFGDSLINNLQRSIPFLAVRIFFIFFNSLEYRVLKHIFTIFWNSLISLAISFPPFPLEIGLHYEILAYLEFTVSIRLVLNSQSYTCLCLLSVGIKGICDHA